MEARPLQHGCRMNQQHLCMLPRRQLGHPVDLVCGE